MVLLLAGLGEQMRHNLSDLSSLVSQPWHSQCLFFLHPVCSPGSSQWGCQRSPCAVKQQMAGQWKICSLNPWVHVGFRVKFQWFPSLLLRLLHELSFERWTLQRALGKDLKCTFVQLWKWVRGCIRKMKNSVAIAVATFLTSQRH